jgi:hypothetical protein
MTILEKVRDAVTTIYYFFISVIYMCREQYIYWLARHNKYHPHNFAVHTSYLDTKHSTSRA